MRWLLCTIVLVVACKDGGSDGLRIRWKPLAVGDRGTHQRMSTLELEITPPGQPPGTMVEEHDVDRVLEVLEVDGDRPAKVKVTYVHAKSRQSLDGEVPPMPEPHDGKTYVVRVEPAAIGIEGDVPAAERDLVIDDLRDELHGVPGIAQVMMKRAWKREQLVELAADDLAKITEGQDITAKRGTIMLREHAHGIASFHVVLDAETDGAERLGMAQTIQLRVDVATGRLVGATVDAKLDGTLDGARATGTMRSQTTATWQ